MAASSNSFPISDATEGRLEGTEMKTGIIVVAAGVLLAAALMPSIASAESDTIILRAPPGASDDHDCFVSVDNKALSCDLALYLGDDKRVRIQFNNDDSGRMVVFEGKKTKTAVVTI